MSLVDFLIMSFVGVTLFTIIIDFIGEGLINVYI